MGCPGANNINLPPKHPIMSFETTGARTIILVRKCEMHNFNFAVGLLLIWANVNSNFD